MKFYKLYKDRRYKTADWVESAVNLDSVICPIDPGHRRAGKRSSNLAVALKSRRFGDFIWTWYSDCVITDRVAQIFRERKLTGFGLAPARVSLDTRGLNDISLPKVWELRIEGWAGMAPQESGIKLDQYCPACGDLHYTNFSDPSKLIDVSQWDGSDFFMVWPLPRFIFVTDRVHKIIREEKLKGCTLIPVEQLEVHGLYGLSPGRLHHWMSEKRARELGEPLGIF